MIITKDIEAKKLELRKFVDELESRKFKIKVLKIKSHYRYIWEFWLGPIENNQAYYKNIPIKFI